VYGHPLAEVQLLPHAEPALGAGREKKLETNRMERVLRTNPQRNTRRSGSPKGKILLSREFLEACLEERLSQEAPLVLDSRQREFLELVAELPTFRDVIAVPKELLEAFLAGQGT
jgi:hypothetical protein